MQEREFLKRIGKKIARFRKWKKMTQMQVADICDMERSAIARIEAGNSNVTAITLLKIGKALDISVKKFFEVD